MKTKFLILATFILFIVSCKNSPYGTYLDNVTGKSYITLNDNGTCIQYSDAFNILRKGTFKINSKKVILSFNDGEQVPIVEMELNGSELIAGSTTYVKKKEVYSNIKLKTEMDSVSYCLGVAIGTQMMPSGIENVDYDLLGKGFKQALEQVKDPKITSEQAGMILNAYFSTLQSKIASKSTEEGKKFLEENKKKSGITTTQSGLQFEVIKQGTGAKPKDTSNVSVHYIGTTLDGKVFDSSVERGEPVTFQLNQVIPGWTEGVQLMSVGSKYKFYIPSELAYGPNPPQNGKIKPNATLIFEVELLEIK